ncbi:MAG: carboxypeptidase regulatory-like domain-containing protein [bacterium]
MKLCAGFTLMELLVVLLIIGVLSTVAVRTIDATRGRALFDQTAAEMQDLVQAVVGDPNRIIDGRRNDFGFYGDLGRLPTDLRELTESTDPRWRGPYLRREFLGDSTGYLFDAWGNPYTYDATTGVISTIGDGKYPMTVRVIDSMPQLTDNSVLGSVADADNNPPGDASVTLVLRLSSGLAPTTPTDRGGYYRFDGVPIGTHRLVAYYQALDDSISRWVSVAPRTRNVVDFRFSRPFRNFLRMVGSAEPTADAAGFLVTIVNTTTTPIELRDATFVDAPDSAFFRALTWDGTMMPGYPLTPPTPGYGHGQTMPVNYLNPSEGRPIEGEMTQTVTLGFREARKDSFGLGDTANISGGAFRLRFNDGSEISFTLPVSP